jgi:hypothetical protein
MHPENASKLISITYFLIPINATQSLLFHREREAFGDQGYALESRCAPSVVQGLSHEAIVAW